MSRVRRLPQPPPPARRDLILLTADKDTAQAIEGLLGRTPALQLRSISFETVIHPQHDPGCLGQSPGILAVFQRTHAHALVVFDREGCGQERLTRDQLEGRVEEQLAAAGWRDNSAVIVIDPELESWVWSTSPHVATALGWRDTNQEVRQWLHDQGFLTSATQVKPDRPKEAMEAVLRYVRKPRSSAIYREIAAKVSLASCTEPSFVKFRQTLQTWFPA